MTALSIQEQMNDIHCVGCGPPNQQGLQLRSHWMGDVGVAHFTPAPHHCAVPKHILNGGIIATLLDSALGCAVHTTLPAGVRHRWQVGDFVIWDNRCMLHRGCGYDADRYRRRMHQTRVRGYAPSIAEALQ